MGVTLDDFFCGFQQGHKTDSIAACSLAQAMMLPSSLSTTLCTYRNSKREPLEPFRSESSNLLLVIFCDHFAILLLLFSRLSSHHGQLHVFKPPTYPCGQVAASSACLSCCAEEPCFPDFCFCLSHNFGWCLMMIKHDKTGYDHDNSPVTQSQN